MVKKKKGKSFIANQNLNYNEVIVVEGKNDKAKLSAIFPNLTIVTTNGSEISEETFLLLEKMAKSREIILFLDPDYPGERIRSIITNRIPNAKQAFMPKKLAIDERKHKVGIEHASDIDIINALNNLLSPSDQAGSLTMGDLFKLGLVGQDKSLHLREKLSQILNLGMPNGKTLLKRLNFLNISYEELEEVINA